MGTNLPLVLLEGPRHPLQEVTNRIAQRAESHPDPAPADLRTTFRLHNAVRRTSKLIWSKRLLPFFHVPDTGAGLFLRFSTKRRNLAANFGLWTHGHDPQVAANAGQTDYHDHDDRFPHPWRITR